MRSHSRFILPLLCLALLGLPAAAHQPAPDAPHAEDIGLPIYPPLAIQANITGRVEAEFTIAQDGSVTTFRILSGPPLLLQSVTDSYSKSRFTCEGCQRAEYTYRVTYDFVLPPDRFAKACAYIAKTGKEPDMPCSAQDKPDHVTVRPKHAVCVAADPAAPRVRSARCLWLWKCGLGQPKPAPGASSSGAAGGF
jgi:hypothetical protein